MFPQSCREQIVGRRKRRRRVTQLEGYTLWYWIDEAGHELVLDRIYSSRRDPRRLL